MEFVWGVIVTFFLKAKKKKKRIFSLSFPHIAKKRRKILIFN